jgi:hypothetical protein
VALGTQRLIYGGGAGEPDHFISGICYETIIIEENTFLILYFPYLKAYMKLESKFSLSVDHVFPSLWPMN